ncbi:hypothetical protein GCM10009624_20840 [Gordonia sinesedis]
MRHSHTRPEVPLVILGDDDLVWAHARRLFAANVPLAVVSCSYSDVVPFMLGNNGYTVALVADVDDTAQLADAIVSVEQRLGPVGSVIRYASDLATPPVPTAA